MFYLLTNGLSLIFCFVASIDSVIAFWLNTISIFCAILLPFFCMILKVALHGKFWDPLVQMLCSELDNYPVFNIYVLEMSCRGVN